MTIKYIKEFSFVSLYAYVKINDIFFSILPTDFAYFWMESYHFGKCVKLFCPVYVRINRIFRYNIFCQQIPAHNDTK